MNARKMICLAIAAVVTSLSLTQLAQAGPRLDKIMESKVANIAQPAKNIKLA
jgi:cyclohexadienyl dehydratase